MHKASLRRIRSLLEGQLDELTVKAGEVVHAMAAEEDPALRADPGDRAALESDRSFDLRLKERDRLLVEKIKGALARIDAGEYGLCEGCGGKIGDKRLEARPITTLCLECKVEAERLENR